ncbi:hypothetical protein Baya_15959 [Bagarius yarrelli]|uniref:Uncharacterized protein n=1 Tax=Bagarius yarrelli TaxID=175774 RepID=A0A556VUL5_BAGYA|nr:hypothetical protein Baya_15959 [Bagarius yarrelli]
MVRGDDRFQAAPIHVLSGPKPRHLFRGDRERYVPELQENQELQECGLCGVVSCSLKLKRCSGQRGPGSGRPVMMTLARGARKRSAQMTRRGKESK